ncbi:MAG: DUF1343 domain-containing protein [Salinivirgaceae bacterium]|nr:DUF1343 domain-containing protein [Salinivirgaceae bacterium]
MEEIIAEKQLNLSYIDAAYAVFYGGHQEFFNNFFYRLAGNRELQQQIENRMSVEEIRATWQEDLSTFKEIRKKYLLYEDFE